MHDCRSIAAQTLMPGRLRDHRDAGVIARVMEVTLPVSVVRVLWMDFCTIRLLSAVTDLCTNR